jgi:hypothetical protein
MVEAELLLHEKYARPRRSLPQRRKGAKKNPSERGSALRLCAKNLLGKYFRAKLAEVEKQKALANPSPELELANAFR